MKVLVKRKRFDTLPTVCGREDYRGSRGKGRPRQQAGEVVQHLGRWCGGVAEQ
jgi:hypothetical protein